jgi:iron complex outermembrane receptor protein
MPTNVSRYMSLGIVIASMGGAGQSLAQQQAQSGALEEIIVTARTREERLQTIPLSITAFSSDDLAKRAAEGMRDIAKLTPGFAFEDYGASGNTSPVIRGATQIAGSVEQPVSFFVDGVYLPRSYVTDIGFAGIERLEVVKGPQSARYGRNAFMGAVNYITRKPGDEWAAQAEGTIGNHSRYDVSGFVSGPVIEDKLGILGGVSYSTFDGSWKNTHPLCDIDFSLGTDCRVGGYEKTTWNVATRITPVDELTVDVSYFNIESNKEKPATTLFGELNQNSSVLNCGQYNPNVRPAGSGTGGGGQWFRLYCGAIPVKQLPIDPRSYGGQLDADLARVGVNYAFSDAVKFDYTYGFVNARNATNGYADQLPGCPYFIPGACVFDSVGISRNRTESHDARFSFDDGGIFRASAGFLYSPSRDLTLTAFATAPVLTAVPTRSLSSITPSDYLLYVTLTQSLTKNKVSSPFAEMTVSLMDKRLRLGVEGRYTHEKRYQQALASGGGGGVLAVTGAAYNATYNYFTPRFTVDFDVDQDHLLYASAARGYKSGGFNTTAFQAQYRVYEGDSNWTYELGTKNTIGNLRINADVFLTKWSQMQIPAADPGNPAVLPQVITLNLGNMTSKGFEFETAYAVNENFTLNATGYYGKATYDDGTFHLNWARTPAVCDNVVCPTNGNISGKSTPRAPKWMGTLGAEWRAPLEVASDLEYFLRSDLTYQSKAYADEMNLAWVPSRTLVNMTAGIDNDNYSVQLWARNVFDEKYNAVAIIQQPNVSYNATMGDRRTFGVTAKFTY